MSRRLLRTGVLFFAGGIAAILVGPFLVPIPALKGTLPPKALADEDSEFINLNDLDIHVKRLGKGEPVFLLLHGFASSLYTWHSVMQSFGKLGTVIAYDRPGFGLSEHPLVWQGQNPYSAEAQVEIVKGLLDHYEVEKAILVGNSAGGTVSMQMALAYPERVKALVLVDPAVYIGHHIPPWIHSLLTTPQVRHLGPLLARRIVTFGEKLIELAWHDPSRLPQEMLEYYRKPFLVENWDRSLWEYTQASRPNNLPVQLKEISLPVLVVTGDDDRIVPTKDSIRLADELPNAHLVVIESSGHIPHEEKPQEFMQAVSDYLRKVAP